MALLGAVGAASHFLLSQKDVAPTDDVDTGSGLPRVFPDATNVWGFGSSTMQLLSPYLVDTFSGAVFHGEGKGGERAEHVFARQGSTPALLTVSGGSIPASGSVTVTAWNMPASSSLKPYSGTLAGVPGVLSSTANDIAFTRTGSGAAVGVVEGTPFLPSTLEAVRNSVALISGGKNNMKDSGDVVGLVTTLTSAAHDWMSPLSKRCVPMTHFVDSDQTPGSVQFNNVQGVDRNILSRFGNIAFDLNAYLLSPQVWADTKISPTPADLQKQAAGLKPDSLSRDAAHINPAANVAIAARIQEHLVFLGYYPEA